MKEEAEQEHHSATRFARGRLLTFCKTMNSRFRGWGRFLILIPVLSYIPLRMFVESWEESHRNLVLSLDLLISGAITLTIAVAQDKKVGIEVFSRRAWTSELMESQDIFLYVPIRLAGAAMLIASCVFACI